jgi:hypothetical protein
MSSPKSTAKAAMRRAANAAGRARVALPKPAAKPVAKPASKPAFKNTSVDAKRIAAAIEGGLADAELDVLSAEALQALIAACARLYTARREAGEDFAPVGNNAVSATDVMVTASGLLRAAGLAAFELGMWQGFTGR